MPRELSLYTKDGHYYVAANVAQEVKSIRGETNIIEDLKTSDSVEYKTVASGCDGAFEIEFDVIPAAGGKAGIEIYNDKDENTRIYLDLKQMRVVMDRTESGLTDFGELAEPHDIEKKADAERISNGGQPMRMVNAVNYKNDFALGTWAPLNLCEGKTYHIDIFVDKCSVELFVDGGRIAMTNLVFPTKPYDSVKFFSENGQSAFKQIKVYKLKM